MTPALEQAYAEPHRRYHTRRHIVDCLSLLDRFDLSEADRRVLTWAIWWHDAIYDATAKDNEEQSAEMAKRDLPALGATPREVEEVARLILLTKGHQVPSDDRLGEVLVSIDLAILGAPLSAYDEYVAQVREEYAFVPEPLWRTGRAAVMRHFLEAPVFYPDPAIRAERETRARANIARELSGLA